MVQTTQQLPRPLQQRRQVDRRSVRVHETASPKPDNEATVETTNIGAQLNRQKTAPPTIYYMS